MASDACRSRRIATRLLLVVLIFLECSFATARRSVAAPNLLSHTLANIAYDEPKALAAVVEDALPAYPRRNSKRRAIFNEALGSCGADARRARALLAAMTECGVAPNARSYNLVMACCLRAGEPAVALAQFEQMEVPADVVSGLSAVNACAQAAAWACARPLLARVRDAGVAPNHVVYSAAISACAAACEWTQAVELLEVMRARDGLAPGLVCYNAAISA